VKSTLHREKTSPTPPSSPSPVPKRPALPKPCLGLNTRCPRRHHPVCAASGYAERVPPTVRVSTRVGLRCEAETGLFCIAVWRSCSMRLGCCSRSPTTQPRPRSIGARVPWVTYHWWGWTASGGPIVCTRSRTLCRSCRYACLDRVTLLCSTTRWKLRARELRARDGGQIHEQSNPPELLW
jgi:hypothetical protein